MLTFCRACISALIVHVVVIPWASVSGFQCFNCTSRETPPCADPFDASRVEKVDCKTSCFKRWSPSHVTRGCSRTAAYKFSEDFQCVKELKPIRGLEVECICNEMDCNSSPDSREAGYSRLVLFTTCAFLTKYLLP